MKHKPKYFYRIFFPFVLVGSLVMIIFNCFAFLFTRDSLEEKIIVEKQENVVQTMNTLEQKLQVVDYIFNAYIYDSSFNSIVSDSLTAKDFSTYKEIDQQLNYISSFGPSQTIAELISLKGNWAVGEHGLERLSNEKREMIIEKYLSLPHVSTWLKEKKEANIKLVKQVPFSQSDKTGVLVVTIPLKSFGDLIYKPSHSDPIYILNQEGSLLYHSNAPASNEDPIDLDILNVIRTSDKPTGLMKVKGDKDEYKVVYSKSSYNGWVYITKINQSEVAQAMKPTIIGISAMSIFMLLVTIVIAYISSDYFSKPIRELQNFIPNIHKEGVRDEFELIGNSLKDVMKKNESLESMVTTQHEQLKTLFMLHLFHGRLDEEEINEELRSFKFPQDWRCLYVLAIQFDGVNNSDYTRKDKDLLLFSINQIVSEMIDENERLAPAVIDDNTQGTIFLGSGEKNDNDITILNQYAESIQKKVKGIFNLTISIGISSPYKKLSDSKKALKEGIDALKYRLKVGKESIIFYESVSSILSNNQINTYFPKTLENQLFDTIKLGDSEKAKDTLYQLLADLFKNNPNPLGLEVNLMRFLNDLLNLMQIMGMEQLTMEEHQTIYQAISDMKTSEEIERFVTDRIMYPMIDTVSERTDSQYKTISSKIIHIIQTEFDQDLSLEVIASRLHYNKNYLSSIFKKEFKQSFSEYLAFYRFEMAKNWLIETNISVKEISERLRYNNSQNFIRSFRKLEGTTPGKYRELHRKDEMSM
ncbi:AraC family transcriptional regulator [Bacillus sp. FJAT-27986]|uniref:AraC family transcriptional regulator n=1 Tax=Bacillus sp. FJAT-27986 TaxID=1743146 RepID=UPI00080AFA64|nr:helix-turn-helix domain-containing protein [Bacillus sp. FJAT-27986]OCA89398.1 hypothetical protein A8L44_00100 [Bacillus sp. FJAT-27986]